MDIYRDNTRHGQQPSLPLRCRKTGFPHHITKEGVTEGGLKVKELTHFQMAQSFEERCGMVRFMEKEQ